jgi:lysine-specific demethylase/histidyl-hydroxylase NO66
VPAKSTGRPAVEHIDQHKVIGLFEQGYTLVIKDAALLSARLQRACNRLQNDLGAYVGANVYFTPPGTQGFELHHDSHDTLTLQIEGTKTWRAYEPVAAVAALTRDSVLSMNADLPAILRERAMTVDIVLPGKSLGLPKLCLSALERLQAGPVRFGDLKLALSDADRHFFVKTLVLEGVLLVDAKMR